MLRNVSGQELRIESRRRVSSDGPLHCDRMTTAMRLPRFLGSPWTRRRARRDCIHAPDESYLIYASDRLGLFWRVLHWLPREPRVDAAKSRCVHQQESKEFC